MSTRFFQVLPWFALSLPIAGMSFLISARAPEAQYRNPGSLGAAPEVCRLDWSGFRDKLELDRNRLAFQNSGGPLGIGLCWWHSRYQRNANYLAEFVGGLVDEKKDKKSIKALVSGNKVVEIAGYQDLEEFSTANEERIREALGCWQLSDSFLKQTWLRGVFAGSSHPSAESLNKQMDDLYDKVGRKGFVIFQMLQMKGPAAHSWLVHDMRKTGHGYILRVVDSNSATPYNVIYTIGDREVVSPPFTIEYPRFAPDTQRNKNLLDYQSAIRKHCEKSGTSSALREISRSDVKEGRLSEDSE